MYFVRTADPPARPDDVVLFLGDAQGVAVEVVGEELSDGRLRIINAMPMRSRYEDLYEEARKWRQ